MAEVWQKNGRQKYGGTQACFAPHLFAIHLMEL